MGLKGIDKLAKERWMYGNSNSKFDAECYSKSYNVNDAKSLQILYQDCSINLHLEAANHVYWLIYGESFQNQVNVVLCIVGSN